MKNYLASNIRFLRTSKQMKQIDLAKVLGKRDTAIANYENGLRTPSIEDTNAIADYFHVSVDRLINEDLAYVADLDATLKADWIREELLRLRLSDKEFDMVENYIQFIVSQRSKNAGL